MESNGVLKNLENDKGLYATMNRWRIDPWLYGDICNVMPGGKIKKPSVLQHRGL